MKISGKRYKLSLVSSSLKAHRHDSIGEQEQGDSTDTDTGDREKLTSLSGLSSRRL